MKTLKTVIALMSPVLARVNAVNVFIIIAVMASCQPVSFTTPTNGPMTVL